MKKRIILAAIIFPALLTFIGCDQETRNGELVLAGAVPVRIVDEGGKTVEFMNGPLTVTLDADSGRKFTVTLTQAEARKAKFSGRAPGNDNSWNFTLRGKEIGQPIDLASVRSIKYYGNTWREIRDGGYCGQNGRWRMENEYRQCNEDWTVAFADANTSQNVGSFRSRREGLTCLLNSRTLYCDDYYYPRPPIPPRLSKAEDAVKTLSSQVGDGVKFD